MEPWALTASSVLAPWSMDVDRSSAALKKNPTAHGVNGARPLGAASPTGGRGVPLAIPRKLKKTRKGFLKSQFSLSHVIKNREPLFIYMPCITLEYG
jgi:hypothetical protein